MKILIATIVIFLLSVISSSTGKTLILSNQKDTGMPACISCPQTQICIAPGNETSIQLPSNATVDTLCVGRYNQVQAMFGEVFYFVYESKIDFDKFTNQIIVKVNSTSFYRSNEDEKKDWEEAPAHTWWN
ncbi:hypothetical protein WN944_027759 [Citrus x changshan-huyou]|uniref:Uncharacterized protein n=1 Tax=Citrus x changshan-huyou TaxID=2935761 RepID=A0AAP0LKL0_9ROSI